MTAINDDQNKLFQLSKFCGLGISGSSELAARAVDLIKSEIDKKQIVYVDDILDLCREQIRSRYDDWFAKFQVRERPTLTLTVVGYSSSDFKTYLLSSHTDFAPNLFPTGNCLAGVPQYAVYLMHRLYDAKMTVGNLTRLAAYLISETATQDPKVGGPIRIASIKKQPGYKELDAKDVEEIIRRNEEQSTQLKQFFFQKD